MSLGLRRGTVFVEPHDSEWETIAAETIAKLQNFAAQHDVSTFEVIANNWLLNQVEIYPKIKNSLREFGSFILKCKEMQYDMSIDNLINYILEKSGYIEELKNDVKSKDESRIDNLEEFINVAIEFEEKNPDEATLEGFLNHVALISDFDVVAEDNDRISLMTVHSAKGLEFPIVFITGFEENIFPHSKALDSSSEMEEERRACYVAITRAEKKLYITYSESRAMYGGDLKFNEPSRFLDEIPKRLRETYIQRSALNPNFVLEGSESDYIAPIIKVKPKILQFSDVKKAKPKAKPKIIPRSDWNIGDKVRHKKWGEGVVIKVEDDTISVRFLDDEHGIKKLALQFAPIEKI